MFLLTIADFDKFLKGVTKVFYMYDCGITLVNKVIDSSNSEMHFCTCLRNYHAEIDEVFYQTDAFGELTVYILYRIYKASGILRCRD